MQDQTMQGQADSSAHPPLPRHLVPGQAAPEQIGPEQTVRDAEPSRGPADLGRAVLRPLAALAAATAASGDLVGAHRVLDELEEEAVFAGDEWFSAEARTTRALVLVEAGRFDEGIAVALEAADTFTLIGDLPRAHQATHWVARTLVAAGRFNDAAAVYGSLLEECRDDAHLFKAASIELGNLLESLGRPLGAARVRAALEA